MPAVTQHKKIYSEKIEENKNTNIYTKIKIFIYIYRGIFLAFSSILSYNPKPFIDS